MSSPRKSSVVIAVLLLACCVGSHACSMKISAAGESPKTGDQDVITVSFTKTHRNCAIPVNKTAFQVEGMKILGATPWKAVKENEFQRKFKVEYTSAGEAVFKVIRTCPKGGVKKELKITVE